jgi:hypothetical protein
MSVGIELKMHPPLWSDPSELDRDCGPTDRTVTRNTTTQRDTTLVASPCSERAQRRGQNGNLGQRVSPGVCDEPGDHSPA